MLLSILPALLSIVSFFLNSPDGSFSIVQKSHKICIVVIFKTFCNIIDIEHAARRI